MLDINYIKENPQEVIDRLAMKGKDAQEDIAKILIIVCQQYFYCRFIQNDPSDL